MSVASQNVAPSVMISVERTSDNQRERGQERLGMFHCCHILLPIPLAALVLPLNSSVVHVSFVLQDWHWKESGESETKISLDLSLICVSFSQFPWHKLSISLCEFIGAFTKLRKAIITFVISDLFPSDGFS